MACGHLPLAAVRDVSFVDAPRVQEVTVKVETTAGGLAVNVTVVVKASSDVSSVWTGAWFAPGVGRALTRVMCQRGLPG